MAVFEDLWAKGLCVVSGSNYGADYVVYNGESYLRARVDFLGRAMRKTTAVVCRAAGAVCML